MRSWRALLTAVYAASFVTLLVVNGVVLRPDGKRAVRSKTGDVSDKYVTLITPADWTFAVMWGLIYLWLACILGYIVSAFFRRRTVDRFALTSSGAVAAAVAATGGGGGVGVGGSRVSVHSFKDNAGNRAAERRVSEDAPATHPFFLTCLAASFLFAAAWLILFDRENVVGSATVLWVVTFFVFVAGIFNYVTLYEKGHELNVHKPSEIWLNRVVVQNGIEVYGTWVMFCAFLNTAIAVQFPPAGAVAMDAETAAYVALGLMLFAFLAWFPFEVTIFDKYCRYGVMQYIVAAFAMGGIYARRRTINNAPLERLVVAFLVVALGMFAVKVFLIVYRAKHKPLFSTKPPPLAPSQR